MKVTARAQEGAQFYQMAGRRCQLVPDGALEHEIWDQLTVGASQETRDQFVKTLHDPRLGDRQPSLSTFGSQWKMSPSQDNYRKTFVMGDLDGAHQVVELGVAGRSGNEFRVRTHLPGVAEHEMSGRFTSFGELNSEYIQEEVILP